MPRLPGLGFDLGETIDMLRDTVQQFADAEIAPRAAAYRPRERLSGRTVEEARRARPARRDGKEEYGGGDLGYLAHIVAMEEVSRASASVGLSFGAHSNLARQPVAPQRQRGAAEKYLPNLSPASTSARWR